MARSKAIILSRLPVYAVLAPLTTQVGILVLPPCICLLPAIAMACTFNITTCHQCPQPGRIIPTVDVWQGSWFNLDTLDIIILSSCHQGTYWGYLQLKWGLVLPCPLIEQELNSSPFSGLQFRLTHNQRNVINSDLQTVSPASAQAIH